MEILAEGYWPYFLLALAIVVGFLLLRQLSAARRLPYEKRECLLTKSELQFYGVLLRVMDDDMALFAMVRIADLVRVQKGTKKYRSWLNRILSKHVDFVVCDRETLTPLMAIELDDRSHERPERQARDKLVNQVFESSGLPLVRFKVEKEYSLDAVRQRILKAL